MLRARPRQRQAVVRAGAAADLVHQHQALRRRVVQDVRGLGHLQHERRAAAGEIVRRADAREHAIDRPDARGASRHVAAHAREDHDQRGLAHVRRFAAHVRAGDDEDAASLVQLQIVRHERLIDELLHDRMAALADLDDRLVRELRRRVAQRHGALGEVRQHVERRERRRRRLQLREPLDQLIQQLVVQLFLARQCAIARAEHLVLEFLQLRRDVALGVLHGLAAVIVRRHAVGEAAIDLDVVALHAVVAEPQIRDAAALRARALPGRAGIDRCAR